jgi:hypothetical protein
MILATIKAQLESKRAHPTDVLNSLIVLENAGGINAICELIYRLGLYEIALTMNGDPKRGMVKAWTCAAMAYVREYSPNALEVTA